MSETTETNEQKIAAYEKLQGEYNRRKDDKIAAMSPDERAKMKRIEDFVAVLKADKVQFSMTVKLDNTIDSFFQYHQLSYEEMYSDKDKAESELFGYNALLSVGRVASSVCVGMQILLSSSGFPFKMIFGGRDLEVKIGGETRKTEEKA